MSPLSCCLLGNFLTVFYRVRISSGTFVKNTGATKTVAVPLILETRERNGIWDRSSCAWLLSSRMNIQKMSSVWKDRDITVCTEFYRIWSREVFVHWKRNRSSTGVCLLDLSKRRLKPKQNKERCHTQKCDVSFSYINEYTTMKLPFCKIKHINTKLKEEWLSNDP